ncbi:hypothetical protein L1887_56517 [Cichorium endivia]|nr:hypothetical protein L1887_56517 [Cichorium endivia]
MKSRPSRPLLHLPLTTAPTPDQDEATLTAWQVVTLPLDRIARSLSDTSLLSATPQDSRPSHLDPFGEFDSISYVKIHANVRLRRIWCSNSLPDHDLAEFQGRAAASCRSSLAIAAWPSLPASHRSCCPDYRRISFCTMSAQHEPPAASTKEKVATAVAPPSAARTDVAARAEETSAVRFVLTDKALDDAFNDVWANNANAISHCYSNTDALKTMQPTPYDFGSEKLNEFTKVLVGDIVGIQEGLYVTSPHESSHPEDNWGVVVTYLNSISRSNTTASIKNLTTTAATASSAHAADAARRIFAFRAISDEVEDAAAADSSATMRSRHLYHTVKGGSLGTAPSNRSTAAAAADDDDDGPVSSKRKVARIVELLCECCADAGAYDPDQEDEEEPFVTSKTIQSQPHSPCYGFVYPTPADTPRAIGHSAHLPNAIPSVRLRSAMLAHDHKAYSRTKL